MKRFFCLLIAALLMLSACRQTPVEPLQNTQPPTESGTYVPGSQLEALSGGALRVYQPGGTYPVGVLTEGEKVLVFTALAENAGLVRMSVYSGARGILEKTVLLDAGFTPGSNTFVILDDGYAYYSSVGRAVVYLRKDFTERRRVRMPEDAVGSPVISGDGNLIHYVIGTDIYGLDISTGIAGPIAHRSCESLELLDVSFAENVLICKATEPDGTVSVEYIRSEDGIVLKEHDTTNYFTSDGQSYLLRRLEGVVEEVLVGTYGQEPKRFLTGSAYQRLFLLDGGDGVMLTRESSVEYYDLTTGLRTAACPLAVDIRFAASNKETIWLLGSGEDGVQLLRWDRQHSSVSDKEIYTQPRQTASAPDVDALQLCRQQADELETRFHVKIAYDDADLVTLADTPLVTEYHAEALLLALDAIESALERLPKTFLQKMSVVSDNKILHIYPVREIFGQKPQIQYWVDGDAYLAVAISSEMEHAIYHGMACLLDSYLLAYSQKLDGWDDLNPDGFAYDYRYEQTPELAEEDFLSGSERAFVDAHAMSAPTEDRATILTAAMDGARSDVFSSDTMQAKLNKLCVAIRDAFGWRKETIMFPWEQHLHESLAYKK